MDENTRKQDDRPRVVLKQHELKRGAISYTPRTGTGQEGDFEPVEFEPPALEAEDRRTDDAKGT